MNESEPYFDPRSMFVEHQIRPGRLVQTKSGKLGRTYNDEELVNGKVRVYCSDGSKLLCSPENLTLKGFLD